MDTPCPEDTLTYTCRIRSNSENFHLKWTVVLPGLMPISITYDNTSLLNNVNHLEENINSSLLNFVHQEYIESTIVLPWLEGIHVICGIDNVEDRVFIEVTSSSK